MNKIRKKVGKFLCSQLGHNIRVRVRFRRQFPIMKDYPGWVMTPDEIKVHWKNLDRGRIRCPRCDMRVIVVGDEVE